MPARFHVFRCRGDNLGLLVHDPATGTTAAVDAPEEAAVLKAVAETGWQPTDILITHEHGDHVEAVAPLKKRFGCKVTGSPAAAKVAPVDAIVGTGSRFALGSLPVEVFDTPGHAAGHVTYHLPGEQAAFVGDVLFVMGCGRVLPGGLMEQMWASLQRVASFPDATTLYGGHDYTVANGRFALHVDPANAAVKARLKDAEAKAARGEFFAVTTLAEEKATNPFLRAGEPALAASAGLPGAPAAAVFAKLREMKNNF
jgi:hydroxyacylglutathione hydrolase